MGCDIHCHIEVKLNGRWEHWSTPQIERSYWLFARMADVRNREEPNRVYPICAARGMVNDPSILTEVAYTHDDGHHHSWLSGKELEDLIEELGNLADNNKMPTTHAFQSYRRGGFGYLFGNGFNAQAHPGDYPDGVEDARLVFWFDS